MLSLLPLSHTLGEPTATTVDTTKRRAFILLFLFLHNYSSAPTTFYLGIYYILNSDGRLSPYPVTTMTILSANNDDDDITGSDGEGTIIGDNDEGAQIDDTTKRTSRLHQHSEHQVAAPAYYIVLHDNNSHQENDHHCSHYEYGCYCN